MSENAGISTVEDGPSIDLRVFLPSLIIVLIAGVYLLQDPTQAEAGATAWKTWVTMNFGWLFLLVATAALGFSSLTLSPDNVELIVRRNSFSQPRQIWSL